jgi:two-component system, OmpR family, response regulator
MMAMSAAKDEAERPRVLVVDDEESITELVSTVLRYEGFEVETAGDGKAAVRAARTFRPDIIVLDVMMPEWDGFEVYRRLNATSHGAPVLFLTARDTPQDRIQGLTLGADDFVGKPFSLEELVLRLRAILRRTRGLAEDSPLLQYDDLQIDEDAREVTRGARVISLSPTEYNLLHYLLMNRERVLSKAQILDHVWNYDFGGGSSVVETYISYLRKKVDADGETPLIHTVRGFGYALRRPRS